MANEKKSKQPAPTNSKWFAIPKNKFPSELLNHPHIGHMKWGNHAYVLVSQGFLSRNPGVARQTKHQWRAITESRFTPHHLRKPRTSRSRKNLR